MLTWYSTFVYEYSSQNINNPLSGARASVNRVCAHTPAHAAQHRPTTACMTASSAHAPDVLGHPAEVSDAPSHFWFVFLVACGGDTPADTTDTTDTSIEVDSSKPKLRRHIQTVGVMGDGRTYEHVIALRCVDSRDAMTADWSQLPYDLLGRISSQSSRESAR